MTTLDPITGLQDSAISEILDLLEKKNDDKIISLREIEILRSKWLKKHSEEQIGKQFNIGSPIKLTSVVEVAEVRFWDFISEIPTFLKKISSLEKEMNFLTATIEVQDFQLGKRDPSFKSIEVPTTETFALLDTPVEKLGLSVGAKNRLRSGFIYTLGDLIEKSEKDLQKIRQLGPEYLAQIIKVIEDCGIPWVKRYYNLEKE
ncbi:MAG: hypothetical protein NTZ44_02935 [Candidatus Nomurabacteria bacterium]|nr:hypothetical protein [Candidatus Nomurabacteria bacterium]